MIKLSKIKYLLFCLIFILGCEEDEGYPWKEAKQIYSHRGLFFLVTHNELKDDYQIFQFDNDSNFIASSNYQTSPQIQPIIDSIVDRYIFLSFYEESRFTVDENIVPFFDTLSKSKRYPDYFIYNDTFEVVYILPIRG